MKKRERKKELEHRITFRLSEKERQWLDALLAKSTSSTQSELIRTMLFKARVTVHTYDRSLDMVMETLSAIRTELHAIGININQVTRHLHQENLPEGRLIQVLKIQEFNKEVGKKMEELLEIIYKLSERWLRE